MMVYFPQRKYVQTTVTYQTHTAHNQPGGGDSCSHYWDTIVYKTIKCNALTLSDAGLCSTRSRMSRNCPGTSSLHDCWISTDYPLGWIRWDWVRHGWGICSFPTHMHSHHCSKVHDRDNLPTLCPAQVQLDEFSMFLHLSLHITHLICILQQS